MLKSVAAVILLVLAATGTASAWTHGSSQVAGKTIIDVGGASTFAGTGYEYPFINVAKTCDSYAVSGTFNYPAQVTANGYPKAGTLSSVRDCVPIFPPSKTDGASVWVIKTVGTFTPGIQLNAGVTVVSDPGSCVSGSTQFTFTIIGTSCRVEFTFTAPQTSSGTRIRFNAGVYDGTGSSLAYYLKANETAFNAGSIFNPDYITALKAIHPRAIRTLDWIGASLTANAAEQSPADCFAYGSGGCWGPNVTTASYSKPGAIDLYTATVAGISSLVDGTTIQVFFADAMTANNPTMDLNGLGAATIFYANAFSLNGAGSPILANSVWTLVWNAINGNWNAQPGNGNPGIPLSLHVALANEVGCDLWITLPFHATDALVTSMVTTTKNTLTGTAYFEVSNEVWNFAGPVTNWALVRGAGLAFPTATFGTLQQITDYYALRVAQVMTIVRSVYGAQTNYKGVVAWQAFGTVTQTRDYRLLGQDLNVDTNATLCTYLGGTFSGTCSGAPRYNTSPNRPFDLADVGSYAAYFSGAQLQGPDTGNYTQLDSSKTINAATLASPVSFQTSAAHGYTSGQRVQMGTNFPTGWTSFNGQSHTVTVLDSTHFTVPVDTSAFASYAGSNGRVSRYQDELTGLLAAADAFAGGSPIANACNGLTTAVAWVDCDVNAGTNYGTLGQQTVSGLATIFTAWETMMAATFPTKTISQYEEALSAVAPAASVCTNYGISASYCGNSGLIANLLGVGPSSSASSYRRSSAFQATASLMFTNFMAKAHSAYPSWYLVAAGYNGSAWQLYSGDLYSTPFTSLNAVQALN